MFSSRLKIPTSPLLWLLSDPKANGGHKSQDWRLEGTGGDRLSTLSALIRVALVWLVPGRCVCLSWGIRTISPKAVISVLLFWTLLSVSYWQAKTNHDTVFICSLYSVPRAWRPGHEWHFQLTFAYNQKPLLFWKTMVRDKNRKIKWMRKAWVQSEHVIFGPRSRDVQLAP